MRFARLRLGRSTWTTGTLAAALLLYAGAVVLDSLSAPVGVFDESQQLLGGLLVDQGLVPHRDFWSPYPPLNYYLLALAYRGLAPSALAARLVSAVFYLAVLAALALHARALSPGSPARAGALALAGAVMLGTSLQNYWWNAYALAVLAVVVAIHAERARGRWLAGALLALAALAKLNFAAYAAAALGLEVALRGLRDRSWRACADALPLLAPPAFAVGLWAAAQGGAEAGEQLLRAPGLGVAPYRALELVPGAGRIAAALALAFPLLWLALRTPARERRARAMALAAAAGVALVGAVSGPTLGPAGAAVPAAIAALALLQVRTRALPRDELVLASAYAFFCHYFVYRWDDAHRATLLAFGALLLPAGAARLRGAARVGALGLAAWLFALAPQSGFSPPDGSLRHLPARERVTAGIALLRAGALREADSTRLLREPLPLDRGLEQLYPDLDEVRALRWLSDRLKVGELVYSGLRDHSRVLLGSIRSYWILARPPGVRHFVLEPGLTTRDDVQAEMVADLEQRGVRFALLWDRPAVEPGRAVVEPSGSARLDAFLRSGYRPVVRYGRWSVFEREASGSAEGSGESGRRTRRIR